MSWRYKGEAGSGVLSDIGSHIADVAEFVGGRALSLQGGRLSTVISQRPLPLGAVTGHDHTAVSDVFEDVENEDYAAFSLELPQGSASIEVSRVARGHANTLTFEVFCENGAARFDQRSTGQFELFDNTADAANNGYRRVLLGPQHPYVAGGLAMDAPSVGLGVNDSFTFQARAFLEEVAGLPEKDSLPRRASFGEGVHNMEILQAAVESAAAHGKRIELT
jgi:predicted dehydrogenase